MSLKPVVVEGLDQVGIKKGAADSRYVLKKGDTMTGGLVIAPSIGDPLYKALTVKAGFCIYLDGQ